MTSPTLPVIDISPFLHPSSNPAEREACARTIYDACLNTGFYYLKNHGIPTALTDHILELARSFFLNASDEEKSSIARQAAGKGDGDGARGWQRVGENVTQGKRDWHEAVDLYRDVDDSLGAPYEVLQGPNRWPRTPASLQETYKSYMTDLLKLGEAVVRAMGYALDPEDEDVFVRQTTKSFWVMRIIGYPPLPSDSSEAGISCGEHTDYGCLTFLLADSTTGALQVQHRSGSWIDADPIPGTFVVNIGDMMERWTNGLWRSTMHRVIHRGGEWRFSVPFFYEPDFEARIKPLKNCVERTGGEEKYDEVVYGNFLRSKVEGNFF
ncbi:MAG: hypothetical protein M1816_004489 [Peltula sp. TS41687]|nr:MAG: hypothetical protein M1816_004489 [Peltula sp. TS41687]